MLETALTHSSYCRDNSIPMERCNERMEFLGDAFLDAIVGEEMYKRLPEKPEGILTKRRAAAVCGDALVVVGEEIGIGKYMRLGLGEKKNGGRSKHSIVGDATEALIGAIYLDGGYDEAKRFVLREFGELIDEAAHGELGRDYKSEIQVKLQAGGKCPEIKYVEAGESGPDHDKTFRMELYCNGVVIGSGIGKNKKQAEQEAARDALERGLKHVL